MRFNLIIVTLIASLSPACGGGGDGEPENAEIDACQLVTEADASELFGQAATRDVGTETPDPAFLGDCLWTWAAPDNSSLLLAIYVWDNTDGLYYTADEGADPLAIGEEGFIKVDDFAGVDIGWRQENVALYLSLFTIGSMVPSATTKVDEVVDIAWQAESRL